jgi:ABC-type transport system involved in cytochrome bd biosynthesis fused ATPase/permease subunit
VADADAGAKGEAAAERVRQLQEQFDATRLEKISAETELHRLRSNWAPPEALQSEAAKVEAAKKELKVESTPPAFVYVLHMRRVCVCVCVCACIYVLMPVHGLQCTRAHTYLYVHMLASFCFGHIIVFPMDSSVCMCSCMPVYSEFISACS